ncbi:MAG: 50S ribosomal protein L29 [Candidatus Pacebacteria bacterium]|nr:50S ribosomal protein L29 [Candidatus Paceibacterota bacterium]
MKDILKKTEKELLKDLVAKRKSLREFRFGVAGSKLKNMKEAKTTKRDIARILTVLNAK